MHNKYLLFYYRLRVLKDPYRTKLPSNFRELAQFVWENKRDLSDLYRTLCKNDITQMPPEFEIFKVRGRPHDKSEITKFTKGEESSKILRKKNFLTNFYNFFKFLFKFE